MCQNDGSSVTALRPSQLGPPEVLAHVVDVHCHPTDSRISPEVMDSLPIRICAMATRGNDQALVRNLAKEYPEKVIPCFGYHPWFSHWIAVDSVSKEEHYRSLFLGPSSKAEHTTAFERLLPYLPEPTLLDDIISEVRENLSAFPDAMLGEVGLDRACRIPYTSPALPPYVENDSRRDLSPFTIPLSHQLAILEAQIQLAIELKRNVSFHSVKCQQTTVGLLNKLKAKHEEDWNAISVDMHSCGLSAETWRDIEKQHVNVFLSLSTVINSRSPAHRGLIAACSPNRILVESDYNDAIHVTGQTWDMLQTIAEVKGWTVEESWVLEQDAAKWGAVRRLEENWKVFQAGRHQPQKRKDRRKPPLEDREGRTSQT
ncbi:hypothetical protein PHLCEN_2v13059 [Hermanssonia centrifuga]|uniref:Metallo-dependent hydrolase n=1 Tax=Hermanssonia centrifuga TaxID=98765 RepID=A0A2R6NFC6_9APHY|nr:hypothetical protein PHLCEN_2v13059 [Hermanssonia centrifuga]